MGLAINFTRHTIGTAPRPPKANADARGSRVAGTAWYLGLHTWRHTSIDSANGRSTGQELSAGWLWNKACGDRMPGPCMAWVAAPERPRGAVVARVARPERERACTCVEGLASAKLARGWMACASWWRDRNWILAIRRWKRPSKRPKVGPGRARRLTPLGNATTAKP